MVKILACLGVIGVNGMVRSTPTVDVEIILHLLPLRIFTSQELNSFKRIWIFKATRTMSMG